MNANEYVYVSHGEPLANESGEISLACKKIVRCRDCREYQPEFYKNITCELLTRRVGSDDFCAWGVRKEKSND